MTGARGSWSGAPRGRARDRRHPRHRHDGRDRARDCRSPARRPTIVLTGAMVPYAFGSSDGLFNLGSALSFAQVLPPGVYIAMNGEHFGWNDVSKNREHGVFERGRHDQPAIPTARRSARRSSPSCRGWQRSSARSTCRRGSRISTATRRSWRRWRATCARDATSTRRCRACWRCATQSPPCTGRRTAGPTIPRPKSPSPPGRPKRSSTPLWRSCIRGTK